MDKPEITALREPPVFVQGAKRLSFDRRDEYDDTLTDTFVGMGKSEGCVPSASWEELCAFAKLIVDHPAFRLPEIKDPYYPPRIEESAALDEQSVTEADDGTP